MVVAQTAVTFVQGHFMSYKVACAFFACNFLQKRPGVMWMVLLFSAGHSQDVLIDMLADILRITF